MAEHLLQVLSAQVTRTADCALISCEGVAHNVHIGLLSTFVVFRNSELKSVLESVHSQEKVLITFADIPSRVIQKFIEVLYNGLCYFDEEAELTQLQEFLNQFNIDPTSKDFDMKSMTGYLDKEMLS